MQASLIALAAAVGLWLGGAATGERSAVPAASDDEIVLRGAGATFPFLLLRRWIAVYASAAPGVNIVYDSVGSSEGVRRFRAGELQFAVSDSLESLRATRTEGRTVEQIPTTLGAVVAAYNLPGAGEPLRLDAEALADVFLGRIRRWDDPRLRALNPHTPLPALPIQVVVRADGSGTTDLFTRYLSTAVPRWRQSVGSGPMVDFPVGTRREGNEGVAGMLKTVPGAIGYVQLSYAARLELPVARLRNRAGRFVAPTPESISAAARGAATPAPGRVADEDAIFDLADAPGEHSYPLAGYSLVVLLRDQRDPRTGKALLAFLWWCLHEGQAEAVAQQHAPLPPEVVALAEQRLRRVRVLGRSADAGAGYRAVTLSKPP